MSTLQELLQKADSYKQKISSARPLEKEELKLKIYSLVAVRPQSAVNQ